MRWYKNGEGTSEYEFKISPGKFSTGNYQFSLYRDNSVSVQKSLHLNDKDYNVRKSISSQIIRALS